MVIIIYILCLSIIFVVFSALVQTCDDFKIHICQFCSSFFLLLFFHFIKSSLCSFVFFTTSMASRIPFCAFLAALEEVVSAMPKSAIFHHFSSLSLSFSPKNPNIAIPAESAASSLYVYFLPFLMNVPFSFLPVTSTKMLSSNPCFMTH